ncbi:MAG: hypothetical protein AABX93_02520 [Nanoarchaeota archaeon]
MRTLTKALLTGGFFIGGILLAEATGMREFIYPIEKKCVSRSDVTIRDEGKVIEVFDNVNNSGTLMNNFLFTDSSGKSHSYDMRKYTILSLNYKYCSR